MDGIGGEEDDMNSYKIMNSIDKWKDMAEAINFKVYLYYGGGLGDLVHRLYDSYYLRALRHIKKVFPNLKINLFIDTSRSIESARALFETNPYIDEIYIQKQDFTNQDIYAFMSNLLGERKNNIGMFFPEMDNEIVFQRVINRIYVLLSFPRIRAISMDSFFQQMNLQINDFDSDEPKIYLKPDEREYGEKIIRGLRADGSKVVAVHFFSGQETKMVSPQAAKEIIGWLVTKGYKVIIMGTGKESNPESYNGDARDMVLVLRSYIGYKNITYLCDDSGIRNKISIIANSDYMVCNDSGLMHVAWFYKVKTVSLLSPDTFDRFQKRGGYYWAITDGMPNTSYILFDRGNRMVDAELVGKRMGCLDEKEKEKAAKKDKEAKG